ncbi:MAG: PQQ-dependent sugar dehydrogenase [Pseudomonadota bacterium]
MRAVRTTTLLLASLALASFSAPTQAESPIIVTSQHSFALKQIASGLEHPWGFDWLPDGRMIVTERPGRIRVIDGNGGVSAPLGGVPPIVSEFRDGLLDIAVSPDFANDGTVYFAYSAKQEGKRWMQLASARLVGDRLEAVSVIHEAGLKVEKDQGFGARIRFDTDGAILVTIGDHAVPASSQDTGNTLGTVIRIGGDGVPAADNPGDGLHPAIYAYGFKNPQGLAVDAATGAVWALDHGGLGGGEVNLIEPGKNYGWPIRTYSGGDAPRAVATGDFADPAFTWGAAPTIAPSGLEIYSGDAFPAWNGDLFIGSLAQSALIRIIRDESGAIVGTERVLDDDIGRIREVRQGPDGLLYIANDDPEGGIFRLDPAG